MYFSDSCVKLQLGNGGLTFEEAKSHFTAWALMKSPLLVRLISFAVSSGIESSNPDWHKRLFILRPAHRPWLIFPSAVGHHTRHTWHTQEH
jgi:hypothetical protein